jgi:hypothetical protein
VGVSLRGASVIADTWTGAARMVNLVGELEVEDGCLVYSYDVKVPGKMGTEEVYVDAGTGKVLKSFHEAAATSKPKD